MSPFDDMLLAPLVMTDLDGVICPDWTGVSQAEEKDPEGYLRHLEESIPLFVPPWPVLAIVTGRLEQYRQATKAWLRRHEVHFYFLMMMNAETILERAEKGVSRRKAAIYHYSQDAILFVESNQKQAEEIHRLTKKPVLCWSTKVRYGMETQGVKEGNTLRGRPTSNP